MIPEAKEKWLTALRSGDYKQGTGYLGTIYSNGETSYCCLGVLCEITHAAKRTVATRIYYDDRDCLISIPRCEALDFSYDMACELANMNDTGKSFIEIADWIEQNL